MGHVAEMKHVSPARSIAEHALKTTIVVPSRRSLVALEMCPVTTVSVKRTPPAARLPGMHLVSLRSSRTVVIPVPVHPADRHVEMRFVNSVKPARTAQGIADRVETAKWAHVVRSS